MPEEPEQPRRTRVPVDWDGLEMALTWRSDEYEYFLDLRSGEIHQYRLSALPGDAEELFNDEAEAGLAEGYFVRIEPLESSVEYGWMTEFAASVATRGLRDRLEVALNGRGAFRRFKDVLAQYPAARERWFRFHDERVRKAIREWLEDHDVEPTTAPPGE